MVKVEACYLEHVCIAVMGVLHHHRLGSRQSVRDAVLVFVAYGLAGTWREKKGEINIKKKTFKFSSPIKTPSFKIHKRDEP